MTQDESYFERLLEKAKSGKPLSRDELREVRTELESSSPRADPYTLLHVVGKADDRTALPIVRSYANFRLEDPLDDGMVRRIAIQILGQWWVVKDAFAMILERAFADPSPLVRAIAASSLGDLGRAHPDLRRDAAEALLRGIHSYGNEQRDVWGSFYVGMLELAGVDPQRRPLRPGELSPEQLDPAVLTQVRRAAES